LEVETLAAAGQPRYRALVLVGTYGGLRFGELAALRRSRVDILRGRVTVAETLMDVGNELTFGPPKTRSALRTVPLPRLVVAALDHHLSRFTAAGCDALVFTGAQGGPLRRSRFRARHWVTATRTAGLAGLRFHDYADLLVMPTSARKSLPVAVMAASRSA
jgi:integrase